MRYCTDTWFLLFLFDKDEKAIQILRNAREGKDYLVIPLIVYAETMKKLMQRGIPKQKIDEFFENVEMSNKVRLMAPDKNIAGEAARLSLTFSIPLLDSFIAATAKMSTCDVLLSGDNDYALLQKSKYLKTQSW